MAQPDIGYDEDRRSHAYGTVSEDEFPVFHLIKPSTLR
jgi:hypothetical protein